MRAQLGIGVLTCTFMMSQASLMKEVDLGRLEATEWEQRSDCQGCVASYHLRGLCFLSVRANQSEMQASCFQNLSPNEAVLLEHGLR